MTEWGWRFGLGLGWIVVGCWWGVTTWPDAVLALGGAGLGISLGVAFLLVGRRKR